MEDKDWAIISPYFKKSEFKCKCGKCNGYGKGIAKSLVITLNFLRKHYGKSINVNSGYRCPSHNKAIGGSATSKHMQGLAADFWFSGCNKNETISHLKKTPYYKYAYSNETNMKYGVHIDTLPLDFGTNTTTKEIIIEKEIIKEVPVEIIKEVIVEKPIEVIKEVIKEVPYEVIKEVEVIKEKDYTIGELIIKLVNKILKKE